MAPAPTSDWAWIWRCLLLAGLLLALYATVLGALVQDWWRDANHSHGFFVPLLSGYLIWDKRRVLARETPRPSAVGLLFVIASVVVLFLASLGAELFLARTSLIGVIIGLVLYFRGWRTLWLLAFPLCFLFLMVPLPTLVYNQIVFPLQLLASRLAAACLQITQLVPVVREGNVLVLPSGSVEVVEACSGIRSLMSLVTLAAAYSYLVENRNWVRTLLIVSMLPVAVVSNATRVMCTAVMTQFWGEKAAEGTVHTISGIILFLVSVTLLLLLHAAVRMITRLLTTAKESA
jgi:exosortase